MSQLNAGLYRMYVIVPRSKRVPLLGLAQATDFITLSQAILPWVTIHKAFGGGHQCKTGCAFANCLPGILANTHPEAITRIACLSLHLPRGCSCLLKTSHAGSDCVSRVV